MFKKVRRFSKAYKQLSFVLASIAIAAALDLSGQDRWAYFVLVSSALFNLIPVIRDMYQDFRDGRYGVDILAATAVIGSILLKEYWAGAVIILMLVGGEALEKYAEKRAQNELHTLLKNKPKTTTILRGKNEVEVKVSEVAVGDRVLVAPGQVVPVDGIVIEGSSRLDESTLTGESLPVTHDVGSQVMSGSINLEGAITINALHTAANSQYEQIIQLIKSTAIDQAPFVRLADRYSIPFTLLAFLIAGSVWFVSGDPVRALEVLVVATPCPLLLGAPIALLSGMSRAAKHGIIVKTGAAMERLADVKTVAFDKTGTLTRGVPVIQTVKTFNAFTKQQVLQYAAALEHSTNHVLARAIVASAEQEDIKINPAKQVKEQPGHGVTGRLQGKTLLVGRISYLRDMGVDIPSGADKAQSSTATYVAIGNQLAGIITFTDELRPESKDLMRYLKKLRVKHTLMVTGDNQATAQTIADQVGIDTVVADCLPGDKIRALDTVKHRPVAFVGDGVNDAPVLTASEIGIALGARGSTAASESADVVIMTDDIAKVASSIAIAKRTLYIGKQSILLGIFISIGLMGVFATGNFKAVQGAIVQEIVDIAVILNALRAHRSGAKLKRS